MKYDELEAIKADTHGAIEWVYPKDEVDAAIDELKAENRKLQRALWMARAERAQEMAWNFHEKNLVEKCAKWDNVHLMCRAKAEEYK